MIAPYYQDNLVTLYHGDCREVPEWTKADVLVTDPPYGRSWRQGALKRDKSDGHKGIIGDEDTTVRDAILDAWGTTRRGLVFGDPLIPPPSAAKLAMVYLKPADAGRRGSLGGVRRDIEMIHMVGRWPSGLGTRSGLFVTRTRMVSGKYGLAARGGHPHAKPLDLLGALLEIIGPGTIADPCAGGGGIVMAAVALGRRIVACEISEEYCDTIVRRLSQTGLPLGGAS